MSKSMCVNEVYFGAIGYADRIAVEESDPLELLIAAEESAEEPNSYPHSSSLTWATSSAEEMGVGGHHRSRR